MDDYEVQIDYNANVYLHHKSQDTYYIVCFDIDSDEGISLRKLSPQIVKASRELCDEYSYMAKHIQYGEIMLSDMTLKGRVTKVINKMDEDEFDVMVENYDVASVDMPIKEHEYFTIRKVHNEDEEEWDDWENEDENVNQEAFIFCGVGDGEMISLSDLLCDTESQTDVMMIRGGLKSKVVTSCIQQSNQFCSQSLVFYSDGYVKIQYPYTKTVILKIECGDDIKLVKTDNA